MKILAIETSSQTLSVATVESNRTVSEYTRDKTLQHSTQLFPAIEKIMQESGWVPSDVDQIVVAKGPGSYTGVRIGVTAAKTLADTLKKPLLGVSSLKVLAGTRLGWQGLIVPIMDARRSTLFGGVYRYENEKLIEVLPDLYSDSMPFFETLKQWNEPLLFVGQDVAKYEEQINDIFGAQATIEEQLPQAHLLAVLATEKDVVDIDTFTPTYLKKSEAEENWHKAHPTVEEDEFVERVD